MQRSVPPRSSPEGPRHARRRSSLLALLFGLAVTVGSTARAAPWEIVIDAGIGGGGEADASPPGRDDDLDPGLLVGLTGIHDIGNDRAFEVAWLHAQSSTDAASTGGGDLDVAWDSIDFAGTYRPERDGARPFVSASAGLVRVAPDSGGFGDDLVFSLSVAGGTTVGLSPRLGLRFLGRGRMVLGETAFAGTCGSGACTVEVFAEGGFRLEGTVGLVVRP